MSPGAYQFYVANGSQCNHKPKLRGLGDVVAKITTALGVKPCAGCGKRQAALNKAVQFS